MFRITDEQELRECFRELDRDEVFLGPELKFPLFRGGEDYLRWLEPSGFRAYLVFKGPSQKAPLGIVFRRDQSPGPAVAAMCDWCHAVRSGNEIGLLSAASSKKRRVGISLCRDLGCLDKIRDLPNANDFSSGASVSERVQRLIARMAAFALRELI